MGNQEAGQGAWGSLGWQDQERAVGTSMCEAKAQKQTMEVAPSHPRKKTCLPEEWGRGKLMRETSLMIYGCEQQLLWEEASGGRNTLEFPARGFPWSDLSWRFWTGDAM